MNSSVLKAFLILLLFSGAVHSRGESRVPYKDSGRSMSVRVRALLSRMTLEEKVGQLNMPCAYEQALGRSIEEKLEGCRKFAAGDLGAGPGPGGGFFTLANTLLHHGPRQQADFFNQLQQIAVDQTRLGIPLLQTEEGTHGLMCSGATIFPEGLALGSSWDLDLIRQIYAVAAREARAVGIHQLFTLVIEPYRDPRLGRNQEGYSEDPYYCAQIAKVIAGAIQADDISRSDKAVAGFCHFPGQSQPVSGLERGAMEISERMLREVFLPPWQAAITTGGALGVMATYPAVDGVPVHASQWLLTEILRHELGFEGLVLSEGGGIATLVYEGLAPTQKEAGQLALKAGVDVGISYEAGYTGLLLESVREGLVAESTVDRSVARVLEQKFRLGLFENPFVDASRAAQIVEKPEDREIALRAALEGIILLKNEGGLLPLSPDLRSIAVIGPNADHPRNQLGDYTSKSILQNIVTILDGIKAKVSSSTRVRYVRGCDVIDESWNEFGKAVEAAMQSEVAVVVVGENEWQAEGRQGTSGEAFDVASLDLTGLQKDLIQKVFATGTPAVVVLVNGRPLSTRWTAENVPAILEAWNCGEEGGNAVAEVLFGGYNPSGKLPVTVARHVGQLPVYYNAKKSKAYWIDHGWGKPYADMSPEPLFEFGFGLSYTTFVYSQLRIEPIRARKANQIRVSVTVSNSGNRTGSEIVQLYLQDRIATVSTPFQELKGFHRVELKPGEAKTVNFHLGPEELSLLNRQLVRVVEPGTFKVMVGSSSKDIRLEGEFDIY